MLKLGIASNAEIEGIDMRVRTEIDSAVKFANDSPFPSLESALENVWPH